MSKRRWVLGASDPEMNAIEADVELARDALRRAPRLALVGQINGAFAPDTLRIGTPVLGRLCSHHDGEPAREKYWWANHSLIADLRDAYTVRTVLVESFVDGATVDAAGVGDSVSIVFGHRSEGAWDEGSHHTFVRRGVAELPDAASREGVAYLAYDGSGRPKVVLGGCTTPEMVRAFLDWAPSQGLVDLYGDPARGFAGGYLPAGVP